MDLAFKDSCAVVTGAARGIGAAISSALQAHGVTVFGLDIVPCPEKSFKSFCVNVANEQEIIEVARQITEQAHSVKYLVNAAGILCSGGKSEIASLEGESWNNVLNSNLNGVFYMLRHFYPLLKKADGASVVNISSDQSFKGSIGVAPYAVSKAGINALTKIAAAEMAEAKIRVNAIAPGPVRTNFLRSLIPDEDQHAELWESADSDLPFGIIELDDVVNAALFFLSSKSRKITGEILLMDSGKSLF